jgi:hypothetical protein
VGIPLPNPSDFLVIFAGTMADRSLPRLVLFFVALTIASGVGASGLYAIVRRGGRPLVERFGSYVHLGPEQLSRSGWGGIAVGRATPGLRYGDRLLTPARSSNSSWRSYRDLPVMATRCFASVSQLRCSTLLRRTVLEYLRRSLSGRLR